MSTSRYLSTVSVCMYSVHSRLYIPSRFNHIPLALPLPKCHLESPLRRTRRAYFVLRDRTDAAHAGRISFYRAVPIRLKLCRTRQPSSRRRPYRRGFRRRRRRLSHASYLFHLFFVLHRTSYNIYLDNHRARTMRVYLFTPFPPQILTQELHSH